LTGRVGLADEGSEQGISAEDVVIVEVFVSQGKGINTLAEQLQGYLISALSSS
jgi:hypothetical protein